MAQTVITSPTPPSAPSVRVVVASPGGTCSTASLMPTLPIGSVGALEVVINDGSSCGGGGAYQRRLDAGAPEIGPPLGLARLAVAVPGGAPEGLRLLARLSPRDASAESVFVRIWRDSAPEGADGAE